MNHELPCKVTLCQSILSGRKMCDVMFHATEMGVTDIIPIFSKRIFGTANEWDTDYNLQRWQAQSMCFMQNSLREVAPVVHKPIEFIEAIEMVKDYDVAILCYENEDDPLSTAKALTECKNAKSIIVFIGCEKGFAPEEVELAKSNGVKIVTLGNRIIRAVNAGAILMGMLTYVLELAGE